MLSQNNRKNKTILSFGAHPDDIELGCGGTQRKLIKEGWTAHHIVMTSGEAGHPTIPPDELAKIREKEARLAAKSLGASSTNFLRLQDGLTQVNRQDKIAVIQWIRKLQPQFIFVHASTDRFNDHKILGDLVRDAATVAAGPWFQEAGEHPWTVDTIYGYEVWDPLPAFQTSVDISQQIEDKVAALHHHKSQLEFTDYESATRGLAQYRGVMSHTGKFAEVFEIIKSPFNSI
ncbi:MAG: PIG-L family deacetylase [Pseudobacteriovorax sp.]|nr:PIG-L family deacetylase [Pseudobacteriovorax sp.]